MVGQQAGGCQVDLQLRAVPAEALTACGRHCASPKLEPQAGCAGSAQPKLAAASTSHQAQLGRRHLAGQRAAADEAVQARRLHLQPHLSQLLGRGGRVGGPDGLVRLLRLGRFAW